VIRLPDVARALDELLQTRGVPDYANALNGVQVAHRGPVRGIAASVDLSLRTIDGAIATGANLLLVHHGLFWGGLQPIVGAFHDRVRALIENDIALYASHLPLDVHPVHGNNALLARELGLTPSGTFGRFRDLPIAVMGECDIGTLELAQRTGAFANRHATQLRTTPILEGRRTRRWGLCTGAGISAELFREALELGLDTIIGGEGPHWSAVDAPDHHLVIMYAGHYATETVGIQSIATWTSERFQLPWTFIDAPTGF